MQGLIIHGCGAIRVMLGLDLTLESSPFWCGVPGFEGRVSGRHSEGPSFRRAAIPSGSCPINPTNIIIIIIINLFAKAGCQ